MVALSPPAPRPGDAHLWYVLAALAVVCGCFGLLGAALFADSPYADRAPVAARSLSPARPDDVATLLNNTPLAIAPADAVALNAARKIDRVSLTAARPFLLPTALDAGSAGTTALQCLTQAIYYEAASESDTGERAVAQVVLNRVRSPLFPHSVCGVVFQGSQLKTGCQFSFTCDGSLRRQPSATGWARAQRIAIAALAGKVERSVGLATHYHADYVVPYWASSLDKVSTIGAHIFYTMRGGLGRPAGFRERYNAEAEATPLIAVDPAAVDATVDASEATLAGAAYAPPRERTVVAEDARGQLSAPTATLDARSAALRADEGRGQLIIDQHGDGIAGAP